MFAEIYLFFKKIFAEHNFSPPPGPLQKNKVLSPSVLSYSVTTFAQLPSNRAC